MDEPDLKEVLARVLGPAEPEVSCDVCFDELDRYVELEGRAPTPTRRCRGSERISRAARPAGRSTTACWRWCGREPGTGA